LDAAANERRHRLFCSKCGKELSDDAKSCDSCGAEARVASEQQPTDAADAAAPPETPSPPGPLPPGPIPPPGPAGFVEAPKHRISALALIAIIVLVMAVIAVATIVPAVLLSGSSQKAAQQKSCQANQRNVQMAIMTYAATSAEETYPTSMRDLVSPPEGVLDSIPTCPSGNKPYIWVKGGVNTPPSISCPNKADHAL
jgi:competence protein ComGC